MTSARDTVKAHILAETADVAALDGWDDSEHTEATRSFFGQMAEWDYFQFLIP